MKTSTCLVRSAPPDSVRDTSGRRFSRAISIARSALVTVIGDCEPPFTVGSFALTMHSTPLIRPMPVTRPAPSGIVGAPAGQRGELEEGRAAVEQEADALARQQLAARPVPGHRAGVLVGVGGAAAGGQLAVQPVDLGQGGQQGLAVGGEELRPGVDVRPQDRGHESDASVKLIRASISLARVLP